MFIVLSNRYYFYRLITTDVYFDLQLRCDINLVGPCSSKYWFTHKNRDSTFRVTFLLVWEKEKINYLSSNFPCGTYLLSRYGCHKVVN